MSTPLSTEMPQELFAMGQPQAQYAHQNTFLSGLGITGLGIVLTLLLLFLWFVVGYIPYILFLAPFLIPIGIYVAIKGLAEGRKRVLVFKDGIAEIMRNKTTLIRWDDVTEINQRVVSRQRRGKETGRRYTYTLRSKDGRLVFDNTYSGIQQLGNTLLNEVHKRLLPRYLESYNRGETLNFGKVSLSKAGLNTGQGPLPWGEVQQFTLSLGKLALQRNGQWTEVAGQNAAQTPNLSVLMAMVKQFTEAAKPAAA